MMAGAQYLTNMENDNNNTTAQPVRKFERITCTRCGGSGRYSYCQRYGSTCFKCAGAKQILTKRGAAAAAYMNDLLSKRADQLQPGDKVRETGVTNGGDLYMAWFTVKEIRPDTTKVTYTVNGVVQEGRADLLAITTEDKRGGSMGFLGIAPEKMYRVAATAEAKAAALKQALDYQDTLTKQGKVAKRARKEVK
jgi:hypothetical protein